MSAALAYQLPLEEQPFNDVLSKKPRLGKKLRLVHSSDETTLLSDCSTKRKSQFKLRCASAPLHGRVVGEYDQAGNAIQETVWFGNQPVATIKGPNIYYIHSDHLNTSRAITDNNNKVVWNWHSDPFGSTLANEDPDGDGTGFTYNLRFPGQYYDQESGLHYNYFRDYDPSTGRYVESDPIGLFGGLNTYGYVNGDPLYWSDPYGLFSVNDPTTWPGIPQSVVDAAAGFGDGISFGLTDLIRESIDVNDVVDKCSATFKVSEIAGNFVLPTAGSLRGLAFLGSTRRGSQILNRNPFFRIGSGRMPRNGSLPAGPKVPRLSIGKGPGNPHIDLRIRPFDK